MTLPQTHNVPDCITVSELSHAGIPSSQTSRLQYFIFKFHKTEFSACIYLSKNGALEIAAFWDVASCSLVEVDRCYRGDDHPGDGGGTHFKNIRQLYESTQRDMP
jgi:hypothetical protein